MLFLVLAFGFLIRLVSLNQSLWLDEGTTALVSRNLSWNQFFYEFLPNDFHPPLYYILVKAFTSVFSNYSEIFLRIPSVLFGVSTIFLIFKIGELKSKKIGLISAALLATAPLHIYYSQEARMYSLATMLIATSVYAYLHKKYLLFSVSLALSFWTDYLAIFMVPVFLIHVWLADRKSIKAVFLSVFKAGVFSLPILAFLPSQLSRGFAQEGSNWWKILGQTNFKNIFLIPIKFVLGRISFTRPLYQIIFVFAGSVWGVFFYYASKKLKENLIFWLWIFVPIIVGVVVGVFVPVLSYFRFLFVLPAFYLLAAFGISKLPKKLINIGIVTSILINLAFSFIYLFNQDFHREDWRAFEKASRGANVVFPSNSQREAFNYYSIPEDIVKDELWLVRYVQDIVDPEDFVRRELEEKGYTRVEEYDFNGVVVWKYKLNYEDSN